MSPTLVLTYGLGLAQAMLVLAMTLAAWRVLRGPRAQDRVLGLDTLYLNGMLAIVVHGMRTGSGLYFEAALVIGLLGFAATLALAKFLMQGEVIQ
ncbi:cation:proton antiporter [Methylobacterium sp. Leaf99]|uniref:K+/H+ antiporter subunit F n=1 Tax=unclassified Methylobacterium TaxID=2615210 RepID=UPI0006F54666|nr:MULTISPECIES: K+/H+ antiporter subunit F [unclassified Methylobacterium]KQP07526.1 cation:proton antiporter [Methylobacterium sp. Leaf99]TXM78399.1 K+/H+ antiporter subunit F [Methylobacterium sp. WL69]